MDNEVVKLRHPMDYGRKADVLNAVDSNATYCRNRVTGEWLPILREHPIFDQDDEALLCANIPRP